MPCRISLRQTDFFKEMQRYLTTMHGNQVLVIELSFIDNFSWKKLLLNLIREVAGLLQEENMYENCWDNKYFLINLDTEVRNNDSITKIWLCKVMSQKRGWQVTKSPPLNPPLLIERSQKLQNDALYVVTPEIAEWHIICGGFLRTLDLNWTVSTIQTFELPS